MGERSENSMSDGGTIHTDVSSIHSNDDTQSSIELEDVVFDFDRTEVERIVAQIPDTPNTRKSVTFSFTEPPKSMSSSLFPSTPLPMRYNPSVDGTVDTYGPEVVIVTVGKGSPSVDERPLLSHRGSINRRNSTVEEVPLKRSTHYMTTWVIFLLICISFFLGGLFLLPLSSHPPSLPLVSSPLTLIVNIDSSSTEPSIHVNRTTREIRIIRNDNSTEKVSFSVFSQSLSLLRNDSFLFDSPKPGRKCGEKVDSDVVCCANIEATSCYVKEGNAIRVKQFEGTSQIADVENFQGRVNILTVDPMRLEFFVDNGLNERMLRIPGITVDGLNYKTAFLQNGSIYSVFDNKDSCVQVVCIDTDCTPVRNPQCDLEFVFPALPSKSLVFMHCDKNSKRREGAHKDIVCTLSQLILPSLTTIGKSEPFHYTRAHTHNRLIHGFADYTNKTLFHMNLLRQREDARWESVVSSYRLITLS